jgi:ankyrin repeat protein
MSGSQSNDALVQELIDFCRSEVLSEDGLREIIEKYGCAPNNHRVENYDFFIVACRNELVTEGILRYLLEYFSSAASATTSRGETPLHMICNNKNATRGMVQLLIDAFPGSLDRAINAGAIGVTPLHFLCFNKDIDDSNAVDILGFFLERCPEAVRHADGDGDLPIHIACGFGSKCLEYCRVLIEAYPGSERIVASGCALLPIHSACRGGTVETAQYLLRLYPESINVANPGVGGGYPIHNVIVGLDKRTNPATAAEMVQMLLDHDSNVALQKWDGEFSPLFATFCTACRYRNNASILNAALKILHLLYDAHPEVIEDDRITSNIDRRDLAIPEEIQTFINAQLTYARQVRNSTARQMKTRDGNGQLPLHRALQHSATLGSIKLLVKRNPSVILIPDNSGSLPLHVAIQHYDSTKVVDYLIGLDPETLAAVDREGNTALHLACRGAKYDTIALLLEKYNAGTVSQSNVCNKLPVHLLFESDAVANRENDTKYLESVFQLLRAYPETVMVSGDAKQASIPQGGRPSRNGKKRKYHHA